MRSGRDVTQACARLSKLSIGCGDDCGGPHRTRRLLPATAGPTSLHRVRTASPRPSPHRRRPPRRSLRGGLVGAGGEVDHVAARRRPRQERHRRGRRRRPASRRHNMEHRLRRPPRRDPPGPWRLPHPTLNSPTRSRPRRPPAPSKARPAGYRAGRAEVPASGRPAAPIHLTYQQVERHMSVEALHSHPCELGPRIRALARAWETADQQHCPTPRHGPRHAPTKTSDARFLPACPHNHRGRRTDLDIR